MLFSTEQTRPCFSLGPCPPDSLVLIRWRLQYQESIFPSLGRRELFHAAVRNRSDGGRIACLWIDPKGIGFLCPSKLVHMDGKGSFGPKIRHNPMAVLVPRREVQHVTVSLSATGEDGLIRNQRPPLLAPLEDFLQDLHLACARSIQGLLPGGQHAPAVIVPVGKMTPT